MHNERLRVDARWRVFHSTLLVAVVLPCVTGCVVISMHSTRPVEVHVTDRSTHEPVPGADVSIQYSYDSYGVFRVLRMPEDATAQTDRKGVAVLPMATFGYGITFRVAGKYYEVTPSLIRHGGYPRGEYYSLDSRTGKVLRTNLPPMVVELIPKR